MPRKIDLSAAMTALRLPPRKSRFGLATTLSVIAHGVLVFWGFWQFTISVEAPELEFEWEEVELLDADQLQAERKVEIAAPEPPPSEPAPPTPPPPEEAPPPESPPEPEAPKPPEPEKDPPKPKKFGDKEAKLEALGPANSTFYMMLSTQKIADLPFAEEAVDVMAPIYDFQFIVQGGGFHPFEDFDYIVIASPDARDASQTFLAVAYRLPQAEMIAGIERGAAKFDQVVEWETRSGYKLTNPKPKDPTRKDWDPRWFVFVDDKTGVYVREEFLDQILGGPSTDGAKTSGNYVANLSRLRKFAKAEPRAGLLLEIRDLRNALKRVRMKNGGKLPFEFPDDIEIMAEAADDPEMVVKLGFLTEDEAELAEQFWNEQVAELFAKNLTYQFLFGAIYAKTSLERDGKRVILRADLNEAQTRQVLQLWADAAARILDETPESLAKMKAERDALWEARKNGELSPSEAMRVLSGEPEELPTDDPMPAGRPAEGDGGERLDPAPSAPDDAPPPAPPADGDALPRREEPPTNDALPDVTDEPAPPMLEH
jgi:hypothetical protein